MINRLFLVLLFIWSIILLFNGSILVSADYPCATATTTALCTYTADPVSYPNTNSECITIGTPAVTTCYCCHSELSIKPTQSNSTCKCADNPTQPSVPATVPVPVNGKWSNWSPCAANCNHTRECNNPLPANGGSNCTGDYTEPCIGDLCIPVNGNWTEWTPIICPIECIQIRNCTNPIPAHNGTNCIGNNIQSCTGGECPINGGWSDWSSCSVDCTRSRTCTHPAPANGGTDCTELPTEACTGGDCLPKVDGHWSDYGACSVACGGGTHNRICNNPSPANGGDPCTGDATGTCNPTACTPPTTPITSCPTTGTKPCKRILLIGDEFSSIHSLATVLKSFSESAIDTQLIIEHSTITGASLGHSLSSNTADKANTDELAHSHMNSVLTLNKLNSISNNQWDKWDYIILQETAEINYIPFLVENSLISALNTIKSKLTPPASNTNKLILIQTPLSSSSPAELETVHSRNHRDGPAHHYDSANKVGTDLYTQLSLDTIPKLYTQALTAAGLTVNMISNSVDNTVKLIPLTKAYATAATVPHTGTDAIQLADLYETKSTIQQPTAAATYLTAALLYSTIFQSDPRDNPYIPTNSDINSLNSNTPINQFQLQESDNKLALTAAKTNKLQQLAYQTLHTEYPTMKLDISKWKSTTPAPTPPAPTPAVTTSPLHTRVTDYFNRINTLVLWITLLIVVIFALIIYFCCWAKRKRHQSNLRRMRGYDDSELAAFEKEKGIGDYADDL